MTGLLAWLVPVALGMGLAGLLAFLWSLRSGQYDDLDGAAERVLQAESADEPLKDGTRDRNQGWNIPSGNDVHPANGMEGKRS